MKNKLYKIQSNILYEIHKKYRLLYKNMIYLRYSNRGNLDKQMKGMIFWTFIYALVSFLFVNKVYGVIQYILSFTFSNNGNFKNSNVWKYAIIVLVA